MGQQHVVSGVIILYRENGKTRNSPNGQVGWHQWQVARRHSRHLPRSHHVVRLWFGLVFFCPSLLPHVFLKYSCFFPHLSGSILALATDTCMLTTTISALAYLFWDTAWTWDSILHIIGGGWWLLVRLTICEVKTQEAHTISVINMTAKKAILYCCHTCPRPSEWVLCLFSMCPWPQRRLTTSWWTA